MARPPVSALQDEVTALGLPGSQGHSGNLLSLRRLVPLIPTPGPHRPEERGAAHFSLAGPPRSKLEPLPRQDTPPPPPCSGPAQGRPRLLCREAIKPVGAFPCVCLRAGGGEGWGGIGDCDLERNMLGGGALC